MSTETIQLPVRTSRVNSDDVDLTHETTHDVNGRELSAPIICYRDPADVRTIRRQSLLILFAFAIVAIAVIGVVYKSIQRPDRIVVDMSSGRTVMINDREFGSDGSSQAGKRQTANRRHGLSRQSISRLSLPCVPEVAI